MNRKLIVFLLCLITVELIQSAKISVQSTHEEAKAAFDDLTSKMNQAVYTAKFQIKAITGLTRLNYDIAKIIENNIGKNKHRIRDAKSAAKKAGRDRSNCDGIIMEFFTMELAGVDVALECIKNTVTDVLNDANKNAQICLDSILKGVSELGNELKNCGDDSTCNGSIIYQINGFRTEKTIAIVEEFKDKIVHLKDQQLTCINIVLEEGDIEGNEYVEQIQKCYA